MGVLGITLLLAIPALDNVADTCKLKAEAEQLAGVMRLARQEAVTSGHARTVIFYPDGRYKVYDQSNHKFTNYRLGNGVVLGGDPTFNNTFLNYPACAFTPLGNPLGGGTVTLKASSGKRIYIITNPIQGRIRVSYQPPENW
jgi:Tfp pilus assembly protein FimT